MVGCTAHSGDTNRISATPATVFEASSSSFFGRRGCGSPFLALLCLCVLAARRLSWFSGRVFADPTPAAWSTQITYVAYISRVGMVLDHEDKSDWLRAGFDGQAGGARRFAGSAGRADPGNGHR